MSQERRICPACGATHIRPTVRTHTGTYCFCEDCRHIWHEESPAPHWADAKRPFRKDEPGD